MAKKFKTEIVTPEKVVFSEEVESLVIPAERGYLGVLAGHAPLLCTLQPGEIRIRGDKGEQHFSTSGGFMEVTPGRAVLLTENAEEASAIDVQRAEESKKRAQERLAATAKGVDKGRAKDALERAQNRLRIAEKYKK
ncbi:MAG TPA: F0F1 ATP synthase subunit epsilon [Planctomycetota bacterium]|jgi:F-type H+-transporting ATPase subunit epsilon|nr:F0F1 ATP synthase subunit epsilon [Planctomycetota bacterium]